MRKIRFTKMHGAGNDFVLIDDRDETFPESGSLIAAMAADRTGVGCEGVILVRKSNRADFRMTFYNPDGTEAELCGNGSRCVAAFAKRIGAVKSNCMTFETGAGLVDAEIVDEGLVKVWMPEPAVRRGWFDIRVRRLHCGRSSTFHRSGGKCYKGGRGECGTRIETVFRIRAERDEC